MRIRIHVLALALASAVAVNVLSASQVTGFQPTSGIFGTEVEIRGVELGWDVRFNGVRAQLLMLSPNKIIAPVPRQATTGPLTVSPLGSGVVMTAGVFVVTQPTPLIRYFTPRGPVGSSVAIAFYEPVQNVRSVKFNGLDAALTPLPWYFGADPGGILVTVPAEAATGPIMIETEFGSETTAEVFSVTSTPVANAPSITAFSPGEGGAGRDIFIEGANLNVAVASVKLNGKAAQFVQAGGGIIARVPVNAVTGPITLVTATGSATSRDSFTVIATDNAPRSPRIIDFWPRTGSRVGSKHVVIRGLNIEKGATVRFNGNVQASLSSPQVGQIEVRAPDGVTTGPITITTPEGSATTTEPYTIVDRAFNLGEIYPRSGAPGLAVTISFDSDIRATTTSVKFNGQEARFFRKRSVPPNSAIVALVPTNATTGPITVTTDLGTARTVDSFTVHTIPPLFLPKITVAPLMGPVGSEIVIRGERLATTTSIQFGGVEADIEEFFDVDILKAIVPAGAKSGPITLVNGYSSAVSTNDFIVTLNDPVPRRPEILSVVPYAGRSDDGIIIQGVNLTNVLSIRFNGRDAVYHYLAPGRRLMAYVPENASSGPLTITTTQGEAIAPDPFYVTSPSISSLSPPASTVNQSITIHGTNFNDVIAVTLNGSPLGFRVVSREEIRANVPANATTGPISVRTRSIGAATTGTNQLGIIPTLAPLRQTFGFENDLKRFTGSGLMDTVRVEFNGSPAIFEITNPTNLWAIVPENATSGPVKITTRGGSVSSAENFVIVPSVDLVLSSEGAGEVTPIQDLSYQFSITNSSRLEASGVFLQISLPSALTFQSATATQGTVRRDNSNIVCDVGLLPKGATAKVTLKATFIGTNPFFVTANVTATEPDRAPDNNKTAIYSIPKGLPLLSVRRLEAQRLEISWPQTGSAGYVLQSREDLNALGGWTTVIETVAATNNRSQAVVPLSPSGAKLFRLFKP
jgi:uncharacterized repeat protein (TIGR01451 family)